MSGVVEIRHVPKSVYLNSEIIGAIGKHRDNDLIYTNRTLSQAMIPGKYLKKIEITRTTLNEASLESSHEHH